MSWASIVGQPLAVRLLRHAVATDRVAHAYLFTGPDGVGKRRVALELARVLNCRAPLPGADACGDCPSCRKLPELPGGHPDVHYIHPETRFIKTDQIRGLQADMYARPTEGRVRMAIIEAAERMNAESGNRLLKLLEEPPGYAVLVLITGNLSGVLPTLVSRCQILNFSPLVPEQIVDALRKDSGLDEGEARLLAALSGGSLGRAVAMGRDAAMADCRRSTWELVQNLHRMDDFDALSFAEGLEKQKEQIDFWLDMLTAWMRDSLLVAQTGSDQMVINADRLAGIADVADHFGASRLLQMLTTITDTRSALQRNANARLVLDMMLLRLCQIARA